MEDLLPFEPLTDVSGQCLSETLLECFERELSEIY
jgi:hypothetical protein